MVWFWGKALLAGLIISFCSWLSKENPRVAGFLIALPISTLLVLLFSYAEYRDPATSVNFARSIFIGIPVSLLFFVPFLLAERLQLSFWLCYSAGIALLIGGYFLHQTITRWLI